MGEGRRALALTGAVTTSDRLAEIGLAVATVVAVIAVGAALSAIAKRNAGRGGLTSALVIVTGGAAVTFVAYLAFQIRCGEAGCIVRDGDTVAGVSPWWRIEHAWQWGGQLLLAAVALTVSSLALTFAARESRAARPLLIAARASYFLWAVLVFLVPMAWEIFAIG